MRVVSLELENFRRFARAQLEFPDGVVGLVGRNGAGKSTLVEAIGWALFGHDASRTGKDHLRRHGTKGDCRVRLVFEVGGETYELTRVLSGKGQQHLVTLKAGGRVLVASGANSAREATGQVERILRMDREAFFTSLVARQGELSALSDLTPARRKEVVLRMLRIDAIDGAIALARDAKRQAQARFEALAGQRGDPAALAAQAEALRAARAEEEARLAEAQRALAGVEASLAAVGKARAAAEELRQRHDALAAQAALHRARGEDAARAAEQARRQRAELAAVEAEAERLRPQLEEHERLRAALDGLEGLRDRHRERARLLAEALALEQDAAQAARALEPLRPDLGRAAAVRAELQGAHEARAAAEQALGSLRGQGAALEQKLAEGRADLARAEARRADLAALGERAHCPTCEQPLAAALPRLLAHLDEELAAHRARVQALEKRRAHHLQQARDAEAAAGQARTREEGLKERAERLHRLETEAAVHQRRRAELDARLQAARAAAEALGEVPFDEAAYTAHKQAVAALGRVHERALQLRARLEQRPALERQQARLADEAAQLEAAWRAAEAQRAALGFDPTARAALEERHAALQARARALDVDVERRRAVLERHDAELARLAAERARQEALEAQLAALRGEVALLDRLAGERDAGLLADFRSQLMGRLRPALAQRAGELFRACTDGRYEGLELTDDYDLLVLEAGQALPLARFSGGEADLANLCLRIAIGQVLAERSGEHLGFLALDEVLGSQDEQRRARILGALAHLRGHFRQILLITHIEEVKDAVEHVVYVEDADDGTARLSGPGGEAPLLVAA